MGEARRDGTGRDGTGRVGASQASLPCRRWRGERSHHSRGVPGLVLSLSRSYRRRSPLEVVFNERTTTVTTSASRPSQPATSASVRHNLPRYAAARNVAPSAYLAQRRLTRCGRAWNSAPPAARGVHGIRGAAVTIVAADNDRTGARARR